MINKNTTNRKGWINRNIDGVPNKNYIIQILINDSSGEEEFTCQWIPFREEDYKNTVKPGIGYLGTATVISEKHKGIGFHAWEQNDSEFIYYQLLSHG